MNDLLSTVKHQHFGEACCSPRTVRTLRLRHQDPKKYRYLFATWQGIIPRRPTSSTLVLQYQSLIISTSSQQRNVYFQVHSTLFSASNIAVFSNCMSWSLVMTFTSCTNQRTVFTACMSQIYWWHSCTAPFIELTLLQQRIMLQHYTNMVTLHKGSFKFILLESCYNAVWEFPHK